LTGDYSVRAESLTKRFGAFVAVDRVDLDVHAGEIFGFLGSNGAGKSTTIRMLCGLLRPTSGSASVAGFDIYREPERIRENIGYMSQRFSLYDELSVAENVDFFGGIYGLSGTRLQARKLDVLARVGLSDRADSATRLLPGGLKQRLALGCAILHEPPILFLDEPTSGVDPMARRSFWELIYHLAEEGHTIFVTTHYMDEAEYCHRLALMHNGRIVALGTPLELRTSLESDRFLQVETEDLMETLRVLENDGGFPDLAIFGGGVRIRVPRGTEIESRLRGVLSSASIRLTDLREVDPGIEDVFVLRVEEASKERR